MTSHKHVRCVTGSCFFHLPRFCQIRKHVNHQVMKQSMHAFVINRLDYCNGIQAGLPTSLLGQLQRAQNAATRLVLGLQPCDYIKPALFKLNLLPVHLRIQYKLCLLMHSITAHCCQSYISDVVRTTAASSRREGLRSSTDTYSYTAPPTFTMFGVRAFSVADPTAWNSLPSGHSSYIRN